MLKGQVISLIIIALTIGIALNQTNAPSLKKGLREANQVVHMLVSWVIKFTPVGVVGVLTPAIAKLGLTVDATRYVHRSRLSGLRIASWDYLFKLNCVSIPFTVKTVFKHLVPLQLSAAATLLFICLSAVNAKQPSTKLVQTQSKRGSQQHSVVP